MTDVIRIMRGMDGAAGTFEVLGENSERIGTMEFVSDGDFSVVAASPWGSFEVSQVFQGGTGKISVFLDKRPLACVSFAKMFMRMTMKMASGPDVPFKMTMFTDTFYHKSDLGEFRYKYKRPGVYTAPNCSVAIKGSAMVDAEEMALAFLALYGFQCHLSQRADRLAEELS